MARRANGARLGGPSPCGRASRVAALVAALVAAEAAPPPAAAAAAASAGKSAAAGAKSTAASTKGAARKPVEDGDLVRDIAAMKKELGALVPTDPYIVVDTHKNVIYYRQGEETLHEALCSTGCDSVLTAADGRRWRFATPTGAFRVKRKIKNPTWVKPDWAFIEEGKPIPKRSDPDRFDDTAMGSYALDFGDGYYIHGTLYRRLLGENITHGCVRVADEDLAPIFEKAKIGTLVLIF